MNQKLTAFLLNFVIAILLVQPVGAIETINQPVQIAHTVQKGDTLYVIAEMYQTTIKAVVSANRIKNPNLIYINQKIIIFPDINKMYRNSIKDAMIADASERSTHLLKITPENDSLTWNSNKEKVLMVAWKRDFQKFKTGTEYVATGEIWVFAGTEMKKWYQKNPRSVFSQTLRMEQLLGLPPKCGYSCFVAIWVKPSDLFRPAPDNEITDSTAELTFPSNATAEYKKWFNNNIIFSYFPYHYPWTRLGYTYDWGNRNCEIGLSEFVVKKNATFTVEKIYSNEDYFKIIKGK
jgi:LysM repeat protein